MSELPDNPYGPGPPAYFYDEGQQSMLDADYLSPEEVQDKVIEAINATAALGQLGKQRDIDEAVKADRYLKTRHSTNISVAAIGGAMDTYGLTEWLWLVRHKENFICGENVEIGNFTVIGCEYGVTIEDNVKIGYLCAIMSDSTVDNKHGPVLLKKGCVIGAGSIIMPNITIGENAIVGANSFVIQDIPAGERWAGTPARILRSKREEYIL